MVLLGLFLNLTGLYTHEWRGEICIRFVILFVAAINFNYPLTLYIQSYVLLSCTLTIHTPE